MIKINLPFEQPGEFVHSGHSSAEESLELAFKAGEKLEFDEKIWGKYKKVLWEKQGHKCCFCERIISSLGEGDVEHYRPKLSVRDLNNQVVNPNTSYWWLAYEWKNFLFSCRTCNNLKGNRFPLEDENKRIRQKDNAQYTHDGKYGLEEPILVNPRYDDVEEFFRYDTTPAHKIRRVYILPTIENNAEGRRALESIALLDLNRQRANVKFVKDTLISDRADVYVNFLKDLKRYEYLEENLNTATIAYVIDSTNVSLKETINLLQKSITEQKSKLLSYSKFDAEFSGMCRYHLKSVGREDLIYVVQQD